MAERETPNLVQWQRRYIWTNRLGHALTALNDSALHYDDAVARAANVCRDVIREIDEARLGAVAIPHQPPRPGAS